MDEAIAGKLGDIVTTEITNMRSKIMNQQRTLWLNAHGVLELRARQVAEARARALAQQERQAAKAAAAAAKLQRAALMAQIRGGAIAPREGPCANDADCYCGNGRCSVQKRKRWDGVDDNWRGCVSCDMFCCPKKQCQGLLNAHIPICLGRHGGIVNI
jgi:hypothetical protein